MPHSSEATTTSSPTRGMWIEIAFFAVFGLAALSHPPHGGCGLKSPTIPRGRQPAASSPTRGMWIEIPLAPSNSPLAFGHPPHGGCGLKCVECGCGCRCRPSSPTRGMWIEIRVRLPYVCVVESSPTRGMWIEIIRSASASNPIVVIPHTGDVD